MKKGLSRLENQGQGRMHLEVKSLSLEGQRYEVKVTLRAEGMLQGGTEPTVHTLLQVKDQRGVATSLGHRANPGPGWDPRQHDSLGLSFLATPRDSEFSILSFSFFLLLFFFCNILPPPPPSFRFCNCSLSSSPVALPGPRVAPNGSLDARSVKKISQEKMMFEELCYKDNFKRGRGQRVPGKVGGPPLRKLDL